MAVWKDQAQVRGRLVLGQVGENMVCAPDLACQGILCGPWQAPRSHRAQAWGAAWAVVCVTGLSAPGAQRGWGDGAARLASLQPRQWRLLPAATARPCPAAWAPWPTRLAPITRAGLEWIPVSPTHPAPKYHSVPTCSRISTTQPCTGATWGVLVTCGRDRVADLAHKSLPKLPMWSAAPNNGPPLFWDHSCHHCHCFSPSPSHGTGMLCPPLAPYCQRPLKLPWLQIRPDLACRR